MVGDSSKVVNREESIDLLDRDAPGVEVEQPNEKANIQAVSDQFNRFQMYNFNEHMHCLRGTHLKTQGVRYECFTALPRMLIIPALHVVCCGQVHRS